MLPQERLAEKILFLTPFRGSVSSLKELEEMMLTCNLRYRAGKTGNDLRLALGKGSHHSPRKAFAKLTEELGKILIIKNWELACANFYFC